MAYSGVPILSILTWEPILKANSLSLTNTVPLLILAAHKCMPVSEGHWLLVILHIPKMNAKGHFVLQCPVRPLLPWCHLRSLQRNVVPPSPHSICTEAHQHSTTYRTEDKLQLSTCSFITIIPCDYAIMVLVQAFSYYRMTAFCSC